MRWPSLGGIGGARGGEGAEAEAEDAAAAHAAPAALPDQGLGLDSSGLSNGGRSGKNWDFQSRRRENLGTLAMCVGHKNFTLLNSLRRSLFCFFTDRQLGPCFFRVQFLAGAAGFFVQ